MFSIPDDLHFRFSKNSTALLHRLVTLNKLRCSPHPLVNIWQLGHRGHSLQFGVMPKSLGAHLLPLGFQRRPVVKRFHLDHHVERAFLFHSQLGDFILKGFALLGPFVPLCAQFVLESCEHRPQPACVGHDLEEAVGPNEFVQVGRRHLRLALLVAAIRVGPADAAITARVAAHPRAAGAAQDRGQHVGCGRAPNQHLFVPGAGGYDGIEQLAGNYGGYGDRDVLINGTRA